MKDDLDFLNLSTATRNQLLKDIKSGRMTPKKISGMVEVIKNLTGKHCLHAVGLHIEDAKYRLKFMIEDMNYTLEY